VVSPGEALPELRKNRHEVEILGLSAFLERIFLMPRQNQFSLMLLDFLCCYTGGKPWPSFRYPQLCLPSATLKNYGLSKLPVKSDF
jgi:hypothetical protein